MRNPLILLLLLLHCFCQGQDTAKVLYCPGIVTHNQIHSPKAYVELSGSPVFIAEIKGRDTIKNQMFDTVIALADGSSVAQYITDHVNFPEVEKEAQLVGTVYVSFILEKDGSVINVKIVKGVFGCPGFAKEVKRVIENMPKLTPHIKKKHPIEAEYGLAIRFVLD